MTDIELLRPAGLVNSPAFSHVAVIPAGATTIQVGGQNAVDAAGSLVGGDDVASQTRQVVANVESALAAAGATFADVISWTILLVDGTDLGAAYAGAARAFDPDRDPPLVSVAKVAGLAVPGALVEATVVAAVMP